MSPDDTPPLPVIFAPPPANDNGIAPGCFRVVIEDEDTGQEYLGWGGITRERAEKIVDFIDGRAVADVKVGRLARRPWKELFGKEARPRGRK